MTLLWILIACLLNSLVAFVGIILFVFKEKTLKKTIKLLIGLATGTLLGGAFFHLFPEAIDNLGYMLAAVLFILGFFIFFKTYVFQVVYY